MKFSDFTKVQDMQGDRSSNLRVNESLIVQHSTDETGSKSLKSEKFSELIIKNWT